MKTANEIVAEEGRRAAVALRQIEPPPAALTVVNDPAASGALQTEAEHQAAKDAMKAEIVGLFAATRAKALALAEETRVKNDRSVGAQSEFLAKLGAIDADRLAKIDEIAAKYGLLPGASEIFQAAREAEISDD
jgi:hypothetical protein